MIDLYSELYDVLNSNFTFHNRDIASILDSSYIFKSVADIEDREDSFEISGEILNSLIENVEKFKLNDNWIFSPQEIEIIEAAKACNIHDFIIYQQ